MMFKDNALVLYVQMFLELFYNYFMLWLCYGYVIAKL